MRCFVGIELDAVTRRALGTTSEALRASDAGWSGEKWVARGNLHVTVAFLGEIDALTVRDASDAIGTRLASTPPFDLVFAGFRAIPSSRRATMMWAEYGDPAGAGAALAREVADACAPLGIALEDRTFKAHVTLVRARRSRRVPAHMSAVLAARAGDAPALLSVPSATLFSSTLTKTGPVYRALETWAFKA